jgi:predicted SAM-dependent methyltransferase
MNKPYINLGCGARFHPDWENVDVYPSGPGVRVFDLRNRIPYPNSSFEFVYCSHLLEHFPKAVAANLLRECQRVLKPSGTIRVAVPDLEGIARLYLEALQRASSGEPGWSHNYDWMLLEMYDQCVRERSMGETAAYLLQDPIPNREFVFKRWGAEALALAQEARKRNRLNDRPGPAWKNVLRNPARAIHRLLTKMILGKRNWEALQVGLFRLRGEVHLWMYDSYSLANALTAAGFHQPRKVSATESRLLGWQRFNLDAGPDGQPHKPDSLYMEAINP